MNLDFRFYFKLFLRRLPYFLFVLAVLSAAGLTLAVMLPPVYRAEAVLIVESQQIPSDLAESTVQVDASEQLQIIQQRILTRDSLIDLANRLGIYADEMAEGRRRAGDEIVADLRERIAMVTTGGGRNSGQATIVRVSFRAPTAQLSSAVTNEVVTMILNENAEMRTTTAGQTLDFFTEEVTRLDQELTAKGAAILAFQQQNLQALPDSLDFRRSQQAAAQERMTQLTRDEAALSDRRARLVTLYEETGTVSQEGVAPRPLSADEQALASLQRDLDAALVVLSPTNPRITVLQAQIAALQARIDTTPVPGEAATDPGLTDYEIQLADIDGQLEFIRAQQDQVRGQMAELQASIEATPGNAITLDTMERDYENLRIQYDQAVANRARAETGDTIEALAKGQRISIIEQAIPPREPESPNRILLAVGGVAGGLFAGLALVVLLELLKPGIRRPVEIVNRLGITPLGTVPLIRTRWEIARRRAAIITGFSLALVGLPAALWLVHTTITPLDELMQRLVSQFT